MASKIGGKKWKKRTILHRHLTKVRVERYLNIKKTIGKKKIILHGHLTKVRVERYLNIKKKIGKKKNNSTRTFN